MSVSLMEYCLPDFSKCGFTKNGLGAEVNIAVQFASDEMCNTTCTGTKDWQQSNVLFCWCVCLLRLGMSSPVG